MAKKKRLLVADLSAEIEKTLAEYGVEALNAVNEAIEEASEKAVDELKRGGEYTERTGKYSADWVYSVRPSGRYGRTALVYNESHYQLTHLLEFGHVIKGGKGRTQKLGDSHKFEHIAPVQKNVEAEFEKLIERKLG